MAGLFATVTALPERRHPLANKLNKRSSLTGNEAPPLDKPVAGDPIITQTGAPAPTASPYYQAPHPPYNNYYEGIHKAYLWFEIQRSGPIPTQRLAWRSDSCKSCTGENGADLSGAWYEAANTMKWGLPLAWTVTQLAYNVLWYKDVLSAGNELNQALTTVKWGTDYLINAHINETTYVGQLGISGIGDNDDIDFAYYLAPETYEQRMPQQYWHPALYCTPQTPCGDIVAESAAALAAGSIIFREYNSTYADLCLQHAESMYTFAKQYPQSYNTPNNTANTNGSWYAAAGWYPSSTVADDIALAGALLYLSTNQSSYLNDSKTYYQTSDCQNAWGEESWDSQGGHLHVLLYNITKDPQYMTNFKAFAGQYLPGTTQTFKQTPLGLAFPEFWGTIALGMNACMAMVTMAKVIGYTDPYSVQMFNFCTQQVNYVMGEKGYSFMVGMGSQYPLRVNHISSYNPYDESPLYNQSLTDIENDFLSGLTNNRRIAYGAIVSGPDKSDHYQDDHQLYQYSEATQDSSAGIIGLLAGLIDMYGSSNFKSFSDCTLDLGWGHPNASAKPNWPSDDCYHTCNTANCNYAVTLWASDNKQIVNTSNVASASASAMGSNPSNKASSSDSSHHTIVLLPITLVTLLVSYMFL
ncbi:Six-hairpin glycosidase-like protein [Umbelopsis sp. AD052]|nr:Six-hairpin glycosidase-like protein [Umbelopsis sp. AD052]